MRKDKPARGTDERFQLDIDMALSAWMSKWRSIFQLYTLMALNLGSHPPERAVTVCRCRLCGEENRRLTRCSNSLFMLVEPLNDEVDKCKKYRVRHFQARCCRCRRRI